MNDKLTKEFWKTRSLSGEFDIVSVTDNDIYRREIEIYYLTSLLKQDEIGLDVGCGSGYGTSVYAKAVKHLTGVDFTENMIDTAKTTFADQKNLSFYVDDITSPSIESNEKYDFIISQRCLINILDKDLQRHAIDNITKMLKPGGRFLMLEGSYNGREKLNEERANVALERMPTVVHNIDFELYETRRFLSKDYVIKNEYYFGYYDFYSRVAYPLVEPNVQYRSKVNEFLYTQTINNPVLLNNFKEYSRTVLFEAYKK